MTENITIGDGGSRATIATRGAEPLAWSVGGRELLWTGDPAFWPRVSPVLFPIVGRARNDTIHVDGRPYPMGIHGFAPHRDFTVTARSADAVSLLLADDAATLAAYPFAFRLEVTYRLEGRGLTADFTVENTGAQPLPFALGFHPGFRWPFDAGERSGYAIVFDKPENPHVPAIAADGLFSASTRAVPLDGARLDLDADTFAREALCFLDARSRSIRFLAPSGEAIRMEAENFVHWALWSRPGAAFACMEAWTGHGDPEGYAGELAAKPSMRRLAAGETSRHRISLRLEAPAGR